MNMPFVGEGLPLIDCFEFVSQNLEEEGVESFPSPPTPIPLHASPHPGSITEASWVCSDAFSWEPEEESSPTKLPELG